MGDGMLLMVNSAFGASAYPLLGDGGMLEVGLDRSPMRAREDYVKAIHQLDDGRPVKAADVARYLGLSRVAVSKAKRLLAQEGLLESTDRRTESLRLTARGREMAVAMMRRHRLLETFLHRSLGVPLDRLHTEAERLEHVLSDDIAGRLATFLGMPTRDPHGHAIPYGSADGREPEYPTLAARSVGAVVEIMTLDDRDATAMQAFVKEDVLPGMHGRIVARDDAAIVVRFGARDARVAREHASFVHVRTPSERGA